MSATKRVKLDREEVAALYAELGAELRRFLIGVLRDPQLAADAMQMAFAKLVERGHEVESEKRKSWLFRVAYHEALALRRREATGHRVLRKLSWSTSQETSHKQGRPDEPLVRNEQIEAVQTALANLPAEQQQVVRMRIYEDKTFAVIASELNVPLGTALSRMRAALKRLREVL